MRVLGQLSDVILNCLCFFVHNFYFCLPPLFTVIFLLR
jgi:hypothetical protein